MRPVSSCAGSGMTWGLPHAIGATESITMSVLRPLPTPRMPSSDRRVCARMERNVSVG